MLKIANYTNNLSIINNLAKEIINSIRKLENQETIQQENF